MQASEARKGSEVRMLKATCSAHLAKKDNNDKIEGFVAVSESIVCVGRLKRICKDALCGAGAVQETSQRYSDVPALMSWEELRFGASDLQLC